MKKKTLLHYITTIVSLSLSFVYADVIIGDGNIERLSAPVTKDINCQNYTIKVGGLLDTSAGGILREVTRLEINGEWDFGTGMIKELGAWVNNGTVDTKPTQGAGLNLEFTTLCGPISVLGTSDTDGDGISDADEGDNAVALSYAISLDQDDDGVYNFLDEDSDGDGIKDSLEGGNNRDSNGNGIPDYLDKAGTIPSVSDDDISNQIAGNRVTIDILANDNSLNPIDASSVSLNSNAIPNAISYDRDNDGDIDKIVVPNEGTWRVDPATGKVVFTPETGFTGDPTPIGYSVKDTNGLLSVSAKITIDYINKLHAVNDTTNAKSGETVILSVLDNDSGDNPIDVTSVLIVDPKDDTGDTVLVVENQGIWTVDTVTGTITFTPEVGFTSDPTPIEYTVEDSEGTVSNKATVTIDYPRIVTPTPCNITPTPTPCNITLTPTPTPCNITLTPTPCNITPPSTTATLKHNDIVATDNHVKINHFGVTVIDVLGNGDNFGEEGACEFTFTQPAHGITSLDDAGTPTNPRDDVILYEPEANYQGDDVFEYTIKDCAGAEDSALVSLDVECSSTQRSDNGKTFGEISMMIFILFTSMLGLYYIGKENDKKDFHT